MRSVPAPVKPDTGANIQRRGMWLMKKFLCIVMALALILCMNVVAFYTVIIYTDIWKYCADFETYENEFILVRDYVKNYTEGRSTILSVSFSEEHKYDLYDSDKKAYLDAPKEIRDALQSISQYAFYYKDSQFEWISCSEDKIAFQISSGPYKLSYCPDQKPTMKTNTPSGMVLRKKIKDGWYHVSVWCLYV